ncbi:MAG: MFS transporter [Gammaproteobacteria bacterium]|nr:MFS transporter [Gammaproteobacteria bacterium]
MTQRLRTPSTAAQAVMFTAAALLMLGNYYVYDSIGPVAALLTRDLGYTQTQIGALNAVYSLPNILLVLVGGVLADRLGARRVICWTTFICLVGALLTALGSRFPVMLLGRLLFGVGAETMIVAMLVALVQWFDGRYLALFLALNISTARLGSFLADRSLAFADALYARGWQPPLLLAAGFAALSMAAALVYYAVDRREAARGTLAIAPRPDAFDWRKLWRFRAPFWYITGICVTCYAVILPFRSTFAIEYLQHAHGMSADAAGILNSNVFAAAAIATPLFGLLVDRVGRHAQLLVAGSLLLPLSFLCLPFGGVTLWISTVLLGVSFSLVPAVLWPAVPRVVDAALLGTAYGLMTMLQNAGLALANLIAGYLNDRGGAGAAHAAGYDAMLWFFGLLSVAGLGFALLLWRQGIGNAATDSPGHRPAS